MLRLYSKRLLSPFIGLVQVAEMERARALSLDGRNCAIQYSLSNDVRTRDSNSLTDSKLNYSLVATIEHGKLKMLAVHPFLESEDVRSAVKRLREVLNGARLPFAATDRYEYWLLDSTDASPLALLHSCIDEEDIALVRPRSVWVAMPAAQLDVREPKPDHNAYVPPVNYRLQKAVEKRAGLKPRAAWFERTALAKNDFPPCLIREDWEDEERQQLCDLYIRRLAPRLLMMQELSESVRHRLERAARDHVFEVERYYPLYPEVLDISAMTAARVEAQLRRTTKA